MATAKTLSGLVNDVARSGEATAVQMVSESKKWLNSTIQNTNPANLLRKDPLLSNKIIVGRMYLFNYTAETEGLPYFDRFPLIFPFRIVPGGFYGINLHYLPYMLRAQLMDALMTLASDQSLTESTRLRMNYNLLMNLSRRKLISPCVKHYLNSNVNSRFLMIGAPDWQKAIFLPFDRFQGARRETVFKDSMRKIRQGR